MEKQIIFGTFNVPPISNDSLTASFTAPSLLPKEIIESVIINDDFNLSSFGIAYEFDSVFNSLVKESKKRE